MTLEKIKLVLSAIIREAAKKSFSLNGRAIKAYPPTLLMARKEELFFAASLTKKKFIFYKRLILSFLQLRQTY